MNDEMRPDVGEAVGVPLDATDTDSSASPAKEPWFPALDWKCAVILTVGVLLLALVHYTPFGWLEPKFRLFGWFGFNFLLLLIVPLLGRPLLLLPVHLILLELLLHPVVSLVFQADAAEDDVMTRPPRPASSGLGFAALWRPYAVG
ncbi:MAG: cation transporting ATPase C-terminal domain-containing protein, partial [Armatimonadota bacterium]